MHIPELEQLKGEAEQAKKFRKRFEPDDAEFVCARHLPHELRLYPQETLGEIHQRMQAALEAYPGDEPAGHLLLRVARECPPESLISFVLGCEALNGDAGMPLTYVLRNEQGGTVFTQFCDDMRHEHAASEPQAAHARLAGRTSTKISGPLKRAADTLHAIVTEYMHAPVEGGTPSAELAPIIHLNALTMAEHAAMPPEVADRMVTTAVRVLAPVVAHEMGRQWPERPVKAPDDIER